jgi:hypothetical protein
MADCSIPCPPLEWDMVKSWSVQVMKGNNFSARFIKLSWGCCLSSLDVEKSSDPW